MIRATLSGAFPAAGLVLLAAMPCLGQEPAPSPSPAPTAASPKEVTPKQDKPEEAAPKPAEPADKPKLPSVRAGKRRTIRGYGNNLLYNFLGVVTPGNHMPLLVTTALTLPALAWDDEGKKYFAQHPHENFGKIGSKMGGGLAVAGLTIGTFSAARISHGERFEAATYDVSQAIIVTQVWTQGLKVAVRRTRPDQSNRVSFPSGHASNAFTAATVIGRHYPRLVVPGYAVATYIAVSRMAANKHHFSDIVAGAGFGYGVGRLVVRRNSRAPDQPLIPTTSFSLTPDGGPSGDGAGLRLVLRF
ncbi:MAG: phosphatase PAP2 family protein [bacterium]